MNHRLLKLIRSFYEFEYFAIYFGLFFGLFPQNVFYLHHGNETDKKLVDKNGELVKEINYISNEMTNNSEIAGELKEEASVFTSL